MKEIKYNCPAIPPYGISVDRKYTFGSDAKGYFYAIGDNKKYLLIEEIKMLFSPIDTDWDSLLRNKSEQLENKNIKK